MRVKKYKKMIPFIKEYLFNHWTPLNLGEKPKDLLFVKFADRGIRAPEVGIISFLVKKVLPEREEPLMILRFPRYASNLPANQSLECEYKNLMYIHEKLGSSCLAFGIPRVCFWQEINSSRVLGISHLPGESMWQGIAAGDVIKKYLANYVKAFTWQMGFQKALGAN